MANTEGNRAEIESNVKNIIASQLAYEGDIKPEHNFVEDLGADSLDTVELVMALEEKFDISIPDTDAEKIATVEDAINYILENAKN